MLTLSPFSIFPPPKEVTRTLYVEPPMVSCFSRHHVAQVLPAPCLSLCSLRRPLQMLGGSSQRNRWAQLLSFSEWYPGTQPLWKRPRREPLKQALCKPALVTLLKLETRKGVQGGRVGGWWEGRGAVQNRQGNQNGLWEIKLSQAKTRLPRKEVSTLVLERGTWE